MTVVIAAVWFNINDQISDLKLDLRTQIEEIRGEIKVLQTKVTELDKDEAKLTERITALVGSYNARNSTEAGQEQEHSGKHRK